MSDKLKLYEERIQRITTTVEHKEPDIVPILALLESWVIGNSGYKINDVANDPQKEMECYGKVYNDIYYDGSLMSFLTKDINMYTPLGGSAYFYSDDGVTIQHKEYVFMTEDDYPLFIKDPLNYIVNENFLRKYPSLASPYPENKEALKNSLNVFINYVGKAQKSVEYAKEIHGMPTCASTVGIAPVDLVMDYFRGFKGIMTDIRRRPQAVKEAAEGLIPLMFADIMKGQPTMPSFPYVFFPLHIPTFLSAKQFGDIYWPSFKKLLDQLYHVGAKVLLYLEGNWEHLYEFINELPKDFALVMLEKDDIFRAKEKIGDTVTIVGGLPLSMMRYSTKEECVDHAKRVVDTCAPGGGFIFATDKLALAPGDINVEKLIAVNNVVHSYGKY